MKEPRQRQLGRARRASDARFGFENGGVQPRLRQDDGCGQPVRS
jgi:hypothetical protein